MAWTLLAFPEAPKAFRRGLAQILQEEQEHARWHAERAAELGYESGPQNIGYLWKVHVDETEELAEQAARKDNKYGPDLRRRHHATPSVTPGAGLLIRGLWVRSPRGPPRLTCAFIVTRR